MDPLVLIRHAKPRKDRSVSPTEWLLEDSERPKLELLAQSLRSLALTQLLTSTEAKAIQTGAILASVLGIPTSADDRLDEVKRSVAADDAEFMAAANAYLAGELVLNWEHQSAVAGRLEAVAAEATGHGLPGFVTHGTAMSTLLGARGLVDPRRFWEELQTPDVWIVTGSTLQRFEKPTLKT